MASFRTGFKIFGEISLKQGLGRIRSFSEDRKPGRWLPEDQWAVRQPGSTCPEPCDKPQKPPKPSKSWLSICKDPEPPVECDVRHNNCPPPPVKEDGPWYSLDNLIPKKKQEKPPPLRSCREEMRRRELYGEEEEVCEKIVDRTFPLDIKPEPSDCRMPKQEPSPAPVVTLSCPLPKELDIMLWCGKPSRDTSRIAAKCHSDKLPYEEFRPQKCWKPPPFSLPVRADPQPSPASYCNVGAIAYSEFKQVDVPKPLYTRYKSVELSDSNSLFSMINATCPDNNETSRKLAIPPPPCIKSSPPPAEPKETKKEPCPERRVIEAASCKPVPIKKATKCKFRPKPTKLVERRKFKNPCAQHKKCDLPFRAPDEKDENDCSASKPGQDCEPPKVITGTLTKEPQSYERSFSIESKPPKWMYVLCKPGSTDTPLIPASEVFPKEPDWSSETDGLKFYDGEDGGITPKPPPDPCIAVAEAKSAQKTTEEVPKAPEAAVVQEVEEPPTKPKNRFVLMPEKYNIKNMRPQDPNATEDSTKAPTFEKFLEAKTSSTKNCAKSYPPMKENILYDLQRLCPNVPFDPSKIKAPCRKPVPPECPQPTRFYRSFSTLTPSALRDAGDVQLWKMQRRTECGDSSGKCKVRRLVPREKECVEKPKPPDCAEITLPCCPKARVPPECNVRKNLPPCKKKLAPKPSFSECSRDPLPCPKMTECNCWENKPGEKNRK